ncbi:MAG: nucleotide sugar dehydrogenase [Rickettsiales bacterium]|nr:nucleotide sugar dehydrogenase [Rickettsiales bacterium]
MTMTYDMCMLGMGPVGTTSAVCIAKQGFNVVGIDINPERVAAFARGEAPFIEPQVNEIIQQTQKAGHFRVTSDAAEAIRSSRIIMIAVGTPTPEETGIPDLSQLDAVAKAIGEAIRDVSHQPIVVVRSTVPPGTMRGRIGKIIAQTSGKAIGEGFHIGSNPEFLREGKAVKDFFHTGRVVIGADNEQTADAIAELYKDVIGKRVKVSVETAEFAKYVDNTWHAVKVTFANEIGRVCQAFGGNPLETFDVFLADDQLNISPYYLRPGFAFGGSCLPKDTRGLLALAKQFDVQIPMVGGLLDSNEEQINLGVERIMRHEPKVVGLLGIAFKEHVDDLRESPALMVASKLMAHGIKVLAHDPFYASGAVIDLPRTDKKLTMSDLAEVLEQSETLAQLHNIELYNKAVKAVTMPLENLTTITNKDVHDLKDSDSSKAA